MMALNHRRRIRLGVLTQQSGAGPLSKALAGNRHPSPAISQQTIKRKDSVSAHGAELGRLFYKSNLRMEMQMPLTFDQYAEAAAGTAIYPEIK